MILNSAHVGMPACGLHHTDTYINKYADAHMHINKDVRNGSLTTKATCYSGVKLIYVKPISIPLFFFPFWFCPTWTRTWGLPPNHLGLCSQASRVKPIYLFVSFLFKKNILLKWVVQEKQFPMKKSKEVQKQSLASSAFPGFIDHPPSSNQPSTE